MEMYLHDKREMFCFVLRGELAGRSVRELELAWTTANSTLGARDLVVDISGLVDADPAGRDLLVRMQRSGACVIPALPSEGTWQPAEPVARYGWSCGQLLCDAVRATKFRQLLGRRRRSVAPGGKKLPVQFAASQGGIDVTRAVFILLAISWPAVAGSPQTDGEALFRKCEFKAATHAFERALATEPDRASLHFWLGKSYARMAEVSSPLSARRNARRAQAHLEAAVRLDPRNREFLMGLLGFYIDSPEWFDGGLGRATSLLERLGPDDGGPGTPSRNVLESRKEYRGPEWALRKGIMRASGVAGYLVPPR